MSEKLSSYFIPQRPQIALEQTADGKVKVVISEMHGEEGQEHHEFVLPLDTAKELIAGLKHVTSYMEMVSQL